MACEASRPRNLPSGGSPDLYPSALGGGTTCAVQGEGHED